MAWESDGNSADFFRLDAALVACDDGDSKWRKPRCSWLMLDGHRRRRPGAAKATHPCVRGNTALWTDQRVLHHSEAWHYRDTGTASSSVKYKPVEPERRRRERFFEAASNQPCALHYPIARSWFGRKLSFLKGSCVRR